MQFPPRVSREQKGKFEKAQLDYFDRIKKMKLKNPYLIGFGISNHETFATAISIWSRSHCGKRICRSIEKF